MHLHEYCENGVDVLQLQGEIDLHYAPVLRALLKAKANSRCRSLLLDFSGVRFIDSTGIAAIVEYLRYSNTFGGRFCIGGLSEVVRTTFEIVRLDKAMPIFADLGKAKEALSYNALPRPSAPVFASAA
ncbi:MAG TPA: STAS domain-containing protein [Chthoniobacterales bacterium]